MSFIYRTWWHYNQSAQPQLFVGQKKMSVFDSAKDYIQNEMAYAINSKEQKKNIYIQNERPLFQNKKSEVKNSANIYLQNERPLFQKIKKMKLKNSTNIYLQMRGHYLFIYLKKKRK